MARALLSLGTSLGDPKAALDTMIEALRRLGRWDLRPLRVSSVYETEPVGESAGEVWFHNLAAVATTTLAPRESLGACLSVERAMGRKREGPPGGPRTIDIDLIAWEQAVVNAGDLILPHPRMHLRRFVLAPLAEVAPDWHHPLLEKTTEQLLEELDDPAGVRVVGPLPESPGHN